MKMIVNQNGFTYILALTVVMIMGVMLGMVGQSWKTIKQRDQEKELIFRGSQIKEAIENWNNIQYSAPGGQRRTRIHPLTDLKDLLQDPYSLSKMRYLPQHYAAKVDDRNSKCAPDCAKLKIYQDPMTGKEWTVIRGSIVNGVATVNPGSQSGSIIGVASKSDGVPIRTDFKDTALENMGSVNATPLPAVAGALPQSSIPAAIPVSGTAPPVSGVGSKMTKYSQWQFIAESPQKNDHSKIYRAYHETW